MSNDWKNEDDIKADLRSLTAELRRLREELRGMVTPPKPNPSREFLHRQSWPPTPPQVAAEQPPRKRSKPKKKG
jgi:hypothetical protein